MIWEFLPYILCYKEYLSNIISLCRPFHMNFIFFGIWAEAGQYTDCSLCVCMYIVNLNNSSIHFCKIRYQVPTMKENVV